MYRKTEVEPAKSNKSTCKKCKKTIEKGELRAKMVDDREFKEYLRRHPDARGCEGYSRGYFEDGARVISIHKFFVHLKCYKPIHPHPKSPQYFKLIHAKGADKQKFQQWLLDEEQQAQPTVKKSQPKSKSKSTSESKSKPKQSTTRKTKS